MASTTSNTLTDNLREWIQSELPQLDVPSPKALSFLTQGPAAEELWTFITTRVRTENHVDQIRSNINLSSSEVGLPTDEYYESQLKQIGTDILKAEKEIVALRAQIHKHADQNSKKQSAHIHDAFNHLFVHDPQASSAEEVKRAISKNVAKLIRNMKETVNLIKTSLEECAEGELRGNEKDDNGDKSKTVKAIEDLHQQTLAHQTAERDLKKLDEGIRKLTKGASSLEAIESLHKAAKSKKKKDSESLIVEQTVEENSSKVVESYVQDTHLKGFTKLCNAEDEYKNVEKQVSEELSQKKKKLPSKEYDNLLTNVMREGEQSFLDFVQKGWESSTSVEKIKASGESSTKSIKDDTKTTMNDSEMKAICMAASKICVGNEKVLQEVRKDAEAQIDDVSMKMINDLQGKFGLIEKWIRELRTALEDDKNMLCKSCDIDDGKKQTSVSKTVDRLRGKLAKRVLEDSERKVAKLKTKSEELMDCREEMVKQTAASLLPEIVKHQEKALECREKDAVQVRDEMRNYVRTPGFSAASPVKEDS